MLIMFFSLHRSQASEALVLRTLQCNDGVYEMQQALNMHNIEEVTCYQRSKGSDTNKTPKAVWGIARVTAHGSNEEYHTKCQYL